MDNLLIVLSINSITILVIVTTIGGWTFYIGVQALTNITIPSSVTL